MGPWYATVAPENKYLYNSKELNGDYEINLMDYGARWYDPAVGRFTGVDPLAEKYFSISPFGYVANMPTIAIDPNGAEIIIVNNRNSQQVIQDLGKIYATKMGRLLIDKLAASNKKYYINGSARTIKLMEVQELLRGGFFMVQDTIR